MSKIVKVTKDIEMLGSRQPNDKPKWRLAEFHQI